MRLNDVLAGMLENIVEFRDRRIKERERARRFEAEQERRAELRRLAEQERVALEKLEADAARWARAKSIREYVAAFDAAVALPQGADDAGAWKAWALTMADRLDPLTPTPDSPLDLPEKDIRPLSRWESFE